MYLRDVAAARGAEPRAQADAEVADARPLTQQHAAHALGAPRAPRHGHEGRLHGQDGRQPAAPQVQAAQVGEEAVIADAAECEGGNRFDIDIGNDINILKSISIAETISILETEMISIL